MKIDILTIHHIHNFGSVFQATALYKYISGLGYETEIINYTPSYYQTGRKKLKTVLGKLINWRSYSVRAKKFGDFLAQNQKLTAKKYNSANMLHKLDCENTVFIAGGDQLWNDFHPCGRDDAYKLSFVKKGTKLAFGTSMGRNDQKEAELKGIAQKVSDFKMIGLREPSTVELLKEYVSCPVLHVADPVMLFDRTWYEDRYIQKQPYIREKYAVVYLADRSPALTAAVAHLQSEGYKIVHICGFIKKCNCDYFMKNCGPEEILSYIFHSDFVLSGSYHATVFSALFHKPFLTILPGEKINARIEDFSKFIGLADRIVKSNDEDLMIKIEDRNIDFAYSDNQLKRLSDHSKQLLENILKEITI